MTLEEAAEIFRNQEVDLVAVNEALRSLATFDARMSQVVELRFFGGLSIEETGEVLKVSSETVMRDWRTAKAWLLQELRRSGSEERKRS